MNYLVSLQAGKTLIVNMEIKKELLYLMPVLLLIGAIGLSMSMSFGRIPGGHILEIRVEDIIIVFLALYWLKRIVIDKQKIAKPPLLLPISLWLGFLFVSTTINAFLGNISAINAIFYYAKELEFFFIYFFIYCHIAILGNVRRVLQLFAAIAIIHSGWILFQAFFGLKISYYYSYTTFIEPEGTSPGGMFLLILFAFLFSVFIYEYYQRTHSLIKRTAMGLVAASPIVGIITSGSRGTFLAFVAVLVVMALLLLRRRVNPAGLRIVVLGITICMFALVAGYMFPSADILNKNDALRVFRTGSMVKSLDGNNSNSRTALWKFNLERAFEQPTAFLFIGGGKSFSYEQQPHNHYLHVFNEGGLIGLSLFLFLLSSILIYAWRGFMDSGDNLTTGLSAGLIAATLGMMASSVFAESFQVVKISEIYWVFVALTLFVVHYKKEYKSINPIAS